MIENNLLDVSRPRNGGQGNRIVDPARAAGQHSMVSHVALQYIPSEKEHKQGITLFCHLG